MAAPVPFLCTPEANHGRQAREAFVVQAEEARAEWRRRNRVSRDFPAAPVR